MLTDHEQGMPLRDRSAQIIPQQIRAEGHHILYDANAIPPPGLEFFDAEHWRRLGKETGTARGRSAVCMFASLGREFVLRHYRRGGWVAWWNTDRYFWTGLEATRAWREWRLLASLHEKGLAVPQPVAARVHRRGMCYRADLVTARIADAHPLADLLEHGPLPARQWQEIGAAIARLHACGILHGDLNVRNILLTDAGQVYLIDFDKAEQRDMSRTWRQTNLTRLRRSLDKTGATGASFHFEATDWDRLLAGYRDGSR